MEVWANYAEVYGEEAVSFPPEHCNLPQQGQSEAQAAFESSLVF